MSGAATTIAGRPTETRARDASGAMALVDLAASAALVLGGASVGLALGRLAAFPPVLRALALVPLALVGPLGVGVERGRTGRSSARVALLAGLGACLGAILGLVLLEHGTLLALRDPARAFEALSPWALGLAALPPLLFAVPLLRAGERLARPDEPWRESARSSPPDATPPFARALAGTRLPLPLRVLLAPLAIAALPVGAALLVLVRCYQLTLSRLMPPQCRFEPSCSRYGLEALRRHGTFRGTALAAFRVLRCQPYCAGGHDPVPARAGNRPGGALG